MDTNEILAIQWITKKDKLTRRVYIQKIQD